VNVGRLFRGAVDVAEAGVETAVPGTRLVKPIAYLVLGLVVIALVVLAWWLLFGRAQHAEAKAAGAKVEAVTAKATAGAAQDAVRVITLHDKEVDHIQTITEGGVRAVQIAADAGTPVPAVAAAMRSSVCLYDRTYSGDAGCVALRGPGESLGAAQPDAGRTSPR